MKDYGNLFHYNPLPNWVYATGTYEILDVNQAALDLYGYDRKAFLALTVMDLVPPECIPSLLAAHGDIHQKKGNIHFGTFTHVNKNGVRLRVEIHGHKVDFRNRASIVAVCQDVTQREARLLALQKSEKRLETASEIAKLGYWKYEIHNGSLNWTDKIYKIWGRDKEDFEVTFDAFYNSLHPDDRELFELELEAALSGQAEMDFVHRIFLPDNSIRWVREQGRLNRDAEGGAISFEGTVQDITAQRAEEQRLKLLESVITHANDAVMITDAGHLEGQGPNIVYVNRAFTQLTGYRPEEIIGSTPEFLRGPKTDKNELQRFYDTLAQGEACEALLMNYRKNGSPYWINIAASPVMDIKGSITHYIAIQRDVSSKINAQLEKDFLTKISTTFKEKVGLGHSLEQVCKLVSQYGDFAFCEVWLPNTPTDSLRIAAMFGNTGSGETFYQHAQHIANVQSDQGLPGTVWKTGQSVLWGNIDRNNLFIRKKAAEKAGLKSVLGLPLKHQGAIVGVLIVGTAENEKRFKSHYPVLSKLEDFLGSEINRKRLEEDLTYLFETLPDLICLVDLNGKFLKMNKAGCNILGYPETEIVGSHFHKFIHDADRETPSSLVQKIKDGSEIFEMENRDITKSGNLIWLNWHCRLVANEGVVYATAKDITKAKKLQEVVSNASRLAQVGGWEINLVNGKLLWSEGVHRIYGTDPESYEPIMGDTINFFRRDYREKIKAIIDQAVEKGKGFEYEAAFISAKGNEKWVRSMGQAEMVNGKCVRLYGSLQDITQLKETEHRLTALSNDLPGVTFQYYLYPDGTDKMGSVSQKAFEIYNLTPEACEENCHLIWDQIKVGGDYGTLVRDIQESIASLEQWHSRWRYLRPDGKLRWHEGYGTPHKLADGTILFNSMVFDITDQVSLGKLLEETSELSMIGSWEMDLLAPSGSDAMFWSPMVRKILEVGPDYDASLSGGMEFFTPESRKIVEKVIEELIGKGTEYDEEVLVVNALGKEKWVRIIGKSERSPGLCTKIFGSIQNIHAMKTTQLQLEEILGSISDGFYALDKDWNFTYFNKEAENMLGMKGEEVLGKRIWERFAGVLGTELETVYRRVAKEGRAKSFEYLYPTNGSWYEINTYPSNGGLSVYFKNIDKRKKAEGALEAAYREKNMILESIGDAFFAVDKDWTVTYWNKQAEFLTGKKKGDIVGKNLWEEYPDTKYLEFYAQYHRAMATGNKASFEEYYPEVGKWTEVTAYPGKEGLSVYFKDITLRKRTDIQVLQANERFQKVAQAATDAIWDWDLENHVFNRSDGFENLFGYKVKKYVEERDIWNDSFHPEDLPLIQSSLKASLLDPTREFWKMEYRIIHKNGEIKTVVDKGAIIRNQAGEAIRMVGAITDNSESIRHEKELEALNEALKKNVRDLELTNDQLEQFAFIASHDLQEPLRMITSFLNQLHRKYSGQLDEKADQYIHFAIDGAKRMKQIILDLLEYSRAGRTDHEPTPLDLDKLIEEYQVLRGRLIRERSVKIVKGKIPMVTGFQAPLTQTLHCLLDNAIKYSREGVPPLIKIAVTDKRDHWQVKINDNGIGIDAEFFDKVFIIFQRLHDRASYNGTGMGLAIAKKNVESWGGRIWLESTPGLGSTFYFTLNKPRT